MGVYNPFDHVIKEYRRIIKKDVKIIKLNANNETFDVAMAA